MENIFLSEEHKNRFMECIAKDKTFNDDVERMALFFILSGNNDIWAKGVNSFYDFNNHSIKLSLGKMHLSSSSKVLINLAFNLYNGYKPRGGIAPVDMFSSLDNSNSLLVFNALKLRFRRNLA